MVTIHWHSSISIGIDKIDEHNRILIGLLNSVLEAVASEPASPATREQFLELIDYAAFHFASEEIWMSHPRYGFITQHHAAHEMLFDQLRQLYASFLKRDGIPVTGIYSLVQSVISHIDQCDRKFAHWCAEALK
jgi:hemerythrin-like metal-binding protein